MSKPTWRMKALALKSLGKRMDMSQDGCSSSPDFNFGECCKEHDYYYRNDESITDVSRSEADKRLRECMQERWKLPILPWVYWGFTRVFGWMPWNKNQKKMDSGKITKLNNLPEHKHYEEEEWHE